MGDNKNKIVVVGHAHLGHGIASHIANVMAMTHDMSIVRPENVMGDLEELNPALPYKAPTEMPIIIRERGGIDEIALSGREARNKRRKENKKKKRRY